MIVFRNKRLLILVSLSLIFMLFFSSCSLLKFNIESQTKPLEPKMLKTRMQTHNFASAFFHEVMLASDSIMNIEKDKTKQ